MRRQSHNLMAATSGFTLVEALLVIAVLGILVSLATPSYRGFVARAHRTEAIGQLLQAAICQERVRASTGGYDNSQCLPAAGENYLFAYLEPAEPGGTIFRVIARPTGAQSSDPCGGLILDSLGQRAVESTKADAVRCWSSR